MHLHFFLKKPHWGTPLFSISALPRYFSLACQAPGLCKQLLFLNSHQTLILLIDVSIPCSAKPLQVLGSPKFPRWEWVVSLDYLGSSQRQALVPSQVSHPHHESAVQPAHPGQVIRATTLKSRECFRLTFNSQTFVNFSFNRLGFMVQRKHSTSDIHKL